jgi:PIN domain nuclease of toxin-antitoxin system
MGCRTVIVLDTHAWIWWTNESTNLSPKALDVINETNLIGIPAICCWELAMLVAKERIGLSQDRDSANIPCYVYHLLA